MQGKVVVITGGTSGIGQVAAERLAGMGARIVLVARSQSRGEATLAEIAKLAPGKKHSIHYGDVSRLADLNALAKEIAAAEPRIDVLINNAGAMFGQRQVTEDGLELTFATNHLSYFVLTRACASADRLGSRRGRQHFVARSLSRNDRFRQPAIRARLQSFPAYSRSKLCNVLFTRVLARRLAGTGVTANSLHPGFVKTRFGDESGGAMASVIGFLKIFAISREGSGDHRLFGFLGRSSENDRPLFLQVQARGAIETRAGRRRSRAALGVHGQAIDPLSSGWLPVPCRLPKVFLARPIRDTVRDAGEFA
jgi:NAD(P)-dependent dehydrogenase (short-subunit alcohol dehydrogenase family)